MLLDKRADINAQGGDCGNALRAASCGGYQDCFLFELESRLQCAAMRL